MPKRKKPTSSGKKPTSTEDRFTSSREAAGYEVGYCKPPRYTQFQPGQSGNPAGRRKGLRNLMTDVKEILKTPVTIKENGRSRKISSQKGALLALRQQVLKGDFRAIAHMIELAHRFNNEPGADPKQALAADDLEILAHHDKEVAAAALASKPGKPIPRVKLNRPRNPPKEDPDE